MFCWAYSNRIHYNALYFLAQIKTPKYALNKTLYYCVYDNPLARISFVHLNQLWPPIYC